MTNQAATILVHLMEAAQFVEILDDIRTRNIQSLQLDLENAVREGKSQDAALICGKIQVFRELPSYFQKLAEAHKDLKPDRT